MAAKPTFVLVPGAWHRTAYFDQIRAYLSEHGYPSVAVATPTVGSDPPATTMGVRSVEHVPFPTEEQIHLNRVIHTGQ